MVLRDKGRENCQEGNPSVTTSLKTTCKAEEVSFTVSSTFSDTNIVTSIFSETFSVVSQVLLYQINSEKRQYIQYPGVFFLKLSKKRCCDFYDHFSYARIP